MNSNYLWRGCLWIISWTHLLWCICGQWILISSAATSSWRAAWGSSSSRPRERCTSSSASARGATNSPLSACQGRGKEPVKSWQIRAAGRKSIKPWEIQTWSQNLLKAMDVGMVQAQGTALVFVGFEQSHLSKKQLHCCFPKHNGKGQNKSWFVPVSCVG